MKGSLQRLLRVPTLAFVLIISLILLQCARPSAAIIVMDAKIVNCANDGTDLLNCTSQLIVTVSAEEQDTPEDVVSIETAVDETAGYTTSPTVSFAPITLSMSRSPVMYRYPMQYAANYNAKPYEIAIKGSLLHECNANFDPKKATCGVIKDSNGEPIKYSQGFCCSCSACQAAQLCPTDARGSCNVLGDFTTASCLRFGDDWYAGYDIGEYATEYTLNVTITTERSSTSSSLSTTSSLPSDDAMTQHATRVLQLGPNNQKTIDTELGVVARIEGEFVPIVPPKHLSSNMLFIPSLPRDGPRIQAGAKEYLFLDRLLVTRNGQCNKVGVSYEAFAKQGNACATPHGTCLGSQIDDYRDADMAAATAGRSGRYMISNFGNFTVSVDGDSKSIAYMAPAGHMAASVVILTIRADDLQYVGAVAAGQLVSTVVTPQPLVDMTEGGVLEVVVKNMGALRASFGLSVSCSADIFPIPNSVLWLEPKKPITHNVSLYVRDPNTFGTLTCHIVLQDSQKTQVDWTDVHFKVARKDSDGTSTDSSTSANLIPADSTEHDEPDRSSRCGNGGTCGVTIAIWCLVSAAFLYSIAYFFMSLRGE